MTMKWHKMTTKLHVLTKHPSNDHAVNTYHDYDLNEKVNVSCSLKLLEQVQWKKSNYVVLVSLNEVVWKLKKQITNLSWISAIISQMQVNHNSFLSYHKAYFPTKFSLLQVICNINGRASLLTKPCIIISSQ